MLEHVKLGFKKTSRGETVLNIIGLVGGFVFSKSSRRYAKTKINLSYFD